MSLRIICSGHLVRAPIGGHTWHHLQYLLGFAAMGHEVIFVEDYGWPNSCYNPALDEMTADPSYGIDYLQRTLARTNPAVRWCYLAEDGQAHGLSRAELRDACRESDLFFNLSNLNWVDEFDLCPRRAMVDTDPVFTQVGAHGLGQFDRYHRLFTYGENCHRPGCDMPTAGQTWLPTRQPVVLDQWPVRPGDPTAPLTTLINWTAYGATTHEGCTYGQKDISFEPFIDLPRRAECDMEVALAGSSQVRRRLEEGGWRISDPMTVSRDPWTYQSFIARSRGEFCVAKHGYVTTRCGWFSDRSAAYLAMGRPVVLQDTGFTNSLPSGRGLLAFTDLPGAVHAIHTMEDDYAAHCQAARAIAEAHFDAAAVLGHLLERAL